MCISADVRRAHVGRIRDLRSTSDRTRAAVANMTVVMPRTVTSTGRSSGVGYLGPIRDRGPAARSAEARRAATTVQSLRKGQCGAARAPAVSRARCTSCDRLLDDDEIHTTLFHHPTRVEAIRACANETGPSAYASVCVGHITSLDDDGRLSQSCRRATCRRPIGTGDRYGRVAGRLRFAQAGDERTVRESGMGRGAPWPCAAGPVRPDRAGPPCRAYGRGRPARHRALSQCLRGWAPRSRVACGSRRSRWQRYGSRNSIRRSSAAETDLRAPRFP